MFADIDNIRMLMAEPNEQETAIVWFSGNRLILVDETLSMVATKSFDEKIINADDARARAEAWFDEMEEKNSYDDWADKMASEILI